MNCFEPCRRGQYTTNNPETGARVHASAGNLLHRFLESVPHLADSRWKGRDSKHDVGLRMVVRVRSSRDVIDNPETLPYFGKDLCHSTERVDRVFLRSDGGSISAERDENRLSARQTGQACDFRINELNS